MYNGREQKTREQKPKLKTKMAPSAKNHRRETASERAVNRHIIMGYVFLTVIFLGVVSAVYYWQYKAQNNPDSTMGGIRHVSSGEQQNPSVNGVSCELKTTMAKHKQTGEVRDFPSACHVGNNWEIIKK
jgi:hypothetical protein